MGNAKFHQPALRLATQRLEALHGSFSKSVESLSALGPKGAATHLARRMLGALRGSDSFRLLLIVLSEPRPTPQAEVAARNHTFRFASAAELEKLHAEKAPGVNPWDIEALGHQCRCLLQLDGDKLVGYTWVCTAPQIELRWGMHFNMPDDMAYNYNGYTTHAYRGTAYQGLRHLKLLELMRGESKRRLFGFVDELNYRSLRGVEKSGYQRVGELVGTRRDGKKQFVLNIDESAWSELVRSGTRQRNAAKAAKALPVP